MKILKMLLKLSYFNSKRILEAIFPIVKIPMFNSQYLENDQI